MALPALPSLPTVARPFFLTNWGLCFLTTSSTHSLSASRLSRPCTNLADLLLPSLTTISLLRSPCARCGLASFGQTSGVIGLFVFQFGFQLSLLGALTPHFANSVLRAFNREVCDLGEPLHSFLIVVFPVSFCPFSLTSACKEHNIWRPRVYFRVGFSPCVSHFDDIRDVQKPCSTMLQQWPFSQSALLWITFLEDSTTMFKLWCSVNWGLRPRLFQTLVRIRVALDVPPRLLTSICDSGFNGAWGLQVPAVGSEASMFCEMSQQPGASFSFRQFHLDGDMSKAPFQLWLFAKAMFQQLPSNKFVFQVRCS